MIISFTGHRPDKIGGYLSCILHGKIQKKIEELLVELNPNHCISGMSQGVDQLAVQACLNLNIPFVAAIPFIGQEKIWPKAAQEQYLAMLASAYKIEAICDPGYASWKMMKRNKWMVDNSDLVIAVYDGSLSGGTFNCIEYARKQHRTVNIINPKEIK